jgi:hypothetical protein
MVARTLEQPASTPLTEVQMIEPNQASNTPARTGPPLWRIAIVVGSLVVLAASAALTVAASPSPSSSAAPGGSTTPTDPDKDWSGPGGFGMRGPGDGFGMHRGAITVTAVSGSNLSLKTDDGWTRTITVTSDTKITKAGTTITSGDIKVGDTIVFQQSRQSDGSYTITAIDVVIPVVGGTIGDVTSSGFTLTDADGVKWTVNVSSSTTYTVDNASGTKSDVKAGLGAVVQGAQSGNTITATTVKVRQQQATGQVTAKTASTITIERRDGTPLTIKVDSSTTYSVNGSTGALADVTVGMSLAASGTANGDGTFSATAVQAGDRGGFGGGFGRGHGHGGMGDWPMGPNPDASPSTSGSTG